MILKFLNFLCCLLIMDIGFDKSRDGHETRYTPEQTQSLLADYGKRHGGTCANPMPSQVHYNLEFAPSMWQFWASDPTKKSFRRKPFMMHRNAEAQIHEQDYLRRKEAEQPGVQPGHFNLTQFRGESGLVADAMSRAHAELKTEIRTCYCLSLMFTICSRMSVSRARNPWH